MTTAVARAAKLAVSIVAFLLTWRNSLTAQSQPLERPEVNDVHFHLTNLVQEGTDIHDLLKIMGRDREPCVPNVSVSPACLPRTAS